LQRTRHAYICKNTYLLNVSLAQTEGEFAQCVGLFTMEEPIFLEETTKTPYGQPFTDGPGN